MQLDRLRVVQEFSQQNWVGVNKPQRPSEWMAASLSTKISYIIKVFQDWDKEVARPFKRSSRINTHPVLRKLLHHQQHVYTT